MRAPRFILGAISIVTIGCTDNQNVSGPSKGSLISTPEMEIAASVSGRIERGAEDEVLRLEKFLPGLGGVYVDGPNIVVFIPEDLNRAEAQKRLALGAVGLNIDERTRQRMIRGDHVVFRTGRFAFSQLVAWSDADAGGTQRLPGVVGIDANEGTNHLTIFVRDASAEPRVTAAALSAGIPKDAIEFEIASGMRSVSGLREKYRPTGGGIQIANSNGNLCTLGLNTTQGDDDKGFYTASHCSPSPIGLGYLGDVLYQHTYASGYALGAVTINPAWDATGTNCAGETLCAQVDAMYVSYDTVSHWSSKVALMTGLANYSGGTLAIGSLSGWWTNINLSTASTSYWEGIDVDKVGRTTGWSRGQLEHTCSHLTLDSATVKEHRVLCADIVKGAYAGQGDSGAPVFIGHDDSNSQVDALGILFGVNFGNGYDYNSEGNAFCNNSNCRYFYSRLSRISLFVTAPY